MIIVVGIIIIALLVAMIVTSMKYAEGRLRKIVWLSNIVVICVVVVGISIIFLDSIFEKIDRKNYAIDKGTILSDISYVGDVDDYYAINISGLFYSDGYFVPKAGVKMSPVCKLFKIVKLYYPQEDGGIIQADDDVFYSPYYYSVFTNICKIVPDYFWVGLYVIIFDFIIALPLNIITFILVLLSLRKKQRKK